MISFEVNDMTCGHCGTISAAIKEASLEAVVYADPCAHLLRVEGAADVDMVERAVHEVWYTPER